MTITALTDAELLDQARNGDEAAFTELYVRHQPAALRLARTYRRLGDPDDLVNASFERVLGAVRRGAGPTDSFRAYLFVTLRRYAAELAAKAPDEALDDVPEPITAAADAPALEQADRTLITEAFESLPDRWQAVLWQTAVEGRQPRELADTLGVSANAAAAMAYRAREKLRQAYLQAHLLASPAPDHEPYRSQLGGYVRGGLSARDTAAVDKHLQGCESCRALVAELEDVNRSLARAVLPLFLLAGGGKLGGALAAGAAAGGAADSAGKGGLLGKLRHAAPAVGSTAAIAAVIAGMVGMGSVVARQDAGPLNSAADAADIGGDGGRGDGGSSGDGRDDAGGSLFGDEDFALSPFDDAFDDLDFGDSGFGRFDDEFGGLDDIDFGDFDGPGSTRSPARRGGTGGGAASPTAPGGGAGTTPTDPGAPPTGPGTPPADPGPQDPGGPQTPPPAPLAFGTPTWTPAAVGRGTLVVTLGEAGAPAVQPTAALEAPTPAPLQAAAEPLRVDLTLSPGARAFPEAPQDPRCAAPTPTSDGGQVMSCTLDQPPAGGTAAYSFDLQIDDGVQTADLALFRGATLESRLAGPVPLVAWEAGLTLAAQPGWSPTVVGGVALPLGTLSTTITAGPRPLTGVTLTISVDRDAAFAPDELFGPQIPPGLLDQLPLSAEVRAAIARLEATALPPGCSLTGWTANATAAAWAALVTGHLPTQVVCTFDLAAGASTTLSDVTGLVDPLYGDRDGATEGTATVTLAVAGRVVATGSVALSTPAAPAS